ncbi:peptide-N-glycosidase F-related protein [Pedobacter sp. KR3-3]|uniref:Peptide-N-glycosidase F-related protein n=1 Tax=Pedobacter albus TaxID=3113905 RepID=A0ABU7I4X1_9SPHI|nr:peptide-N-glycosidase F-related protein [Pedobacter sp. KR3-3]MEE1944381.1 peptide-N-glycosidase F-related protein [Pedobacter sp. KR3-3]
MKNYFFTCLALCLISASSLKASERDSLRLTVFDNIVYYDGYAQLVPLKVQEGIYRSNTSYTRKLNDREIALLTNEDVNMQVDLKAACDNYDRIANVALLLIEKGKNYPAVTKRIEIGRYITPFMDMNKQPNVRPYVWDASAIGKIVGNKSFADQYDFYIQMNVFGVPYAAQKQVKGCEGRNDVFIGNLYFDVKASQKKSKAVYQLIPIAYSDSLNNYKATDSLGKTTRTYTFKAEKNLKDVEFFIISSNHGANKNGEEYNRRVHYVYLDNVLQLKYIPGENTCEPYRQYNTQSNGIYGKTPKTDEQWQKFSNWCPGAVIPLRKIKLDQLKKGEHCLQIVVPDAKFENKEGYIPFSAYALGR